MESFTGSSKDGSRELAPGEAVCCGSQFRYHGHSRVQKDLEDLTSSLVFQDDWPREETVDEEEVRNHPELIIALGILQYKNMARLSECLYSIRREHIRGVVLRFRGEVEGKVPEVPNLLLSLGDQGRGLNSASHRLNLMGIQSPKAYSNYHWIWYVQDITAS